MRPPMILEAIRKFRSALAVKSTRATAAYITRLTATATFAYLLALLIPAGTSRPVLAPLTALLVLQASTYQTIRSGVKKVLSVTVGVLVAVSLSEFIGFSWWLLALLIAAALLIGRMLRLGDDLLEVPISAMLIFSSVGTHAAATGRVVDTLAGTAAGLIGGLAFLLAELLDPRAGALSVSETADGAARGSAGTEWPLRGEILAHVDRLRTGLTANSIPRQRHQPRLRTRPRPIRLRAAKRPRPPGQLLAQTRRSLSRPGSLASTRRR